MPSFDIVSEVNMAELENALTQARKEMETRYDLKGAKTTMEKLAKANEIQLKANSDEKLGIIREMLLAKISKRGISLRNIDYSKVEESGVQLYKQTLTVKEGIETEKAKKVTALIRDSKLKVQASIQGEAIRITGKNKDDLQSAMALVRGNMDQLELSVQFSNFRD